MATQQLPDSVLHLHHQEEHNSFSLMANRKDAKRISDHLPRPWAHSLEQENGFTGNASPNNVSKGAGDKDSHHCWTKVKGPDERKLLSNIVFEWD